nr:MAG TPA: hypothetical protein [Caudoviricetes sp.]
MAGSAPIRDTHNVVDITCGGAEIGRHPSPGVA